jgi:D-aminopeptidase
MTAISWEGSLSAVKYRSISRVCGDVSMGCGPTETRNADSSPVPAGGAVLNGAGECTGFLAAAEWGLAETPVFLTSTMQVGRVYDAACELLMAEDPGIGAEDVIIPIVAECDDSFLSDARRMQVSAADVAVALAGGTSAGGQPAAEGAVGAGTGMSCLGFKGGIGTASRVLPSGHTVGVLVLANFGDPQRLTVDGVPVGRLIQPPAAGSEQPPAGSCLAIAVTDGPLDSAARARLARRGCLGRPGPARSRTMPAARSSLRWPRAVRAPRGRARRGPGDHRPRASTCPFAAVTEATEEARLNCLLAAPTVTGRDGHTSVSRLARGSGQELPARPGGSEREPAIIRACWVPAARGPGAGVRRAAAGRGSGQRGGQVAGDHPAARSRKIRPARRSSRRCSAAVTGSVGLRQDG